MNGYCRKKRKLIKIILLSPLQARSKINQHKSLYPICTYAYNDLGKIKRFSKGIAACARVYNNLYLFGIAQHVLNKYTQLNWFVCVQNTIYFISKYIWDAKLGKIFFL